MRFRHGRSVGPVLMLATALVCSSVCSCGPGNPTPDAVGTADTLLPPVFDALPDIPSDDADPSDADPSDADAPNTDADPDAVVGTAFCSMGTALPATTVPPGFCLRQFAKVNEPRSLAFAPNGDLFVGAPSMGTSGGAAAGPGAILVLSDDNRDGTAEIATFLDGVPDVHGLVIGDGYLYFATAATVFRTPYVAGQRRETGPRENLNLPATFKGGGRWTHALARSVGGTMYTARGEYGSCGMSAGGEISQIQPGGGLTTVASGFRNPLYMRCHYRDELCAANELGEDQIPGAREKLIALKPGKLYGYPCCFTANKPAPGSAAANCTNVAMEEASFTLSDTPFGLDWERGVWPEPYRGGLFVALHGSFYSSPQWAGARIVYARTDPQTHLPIDAQPWRDFAGGFGPKGSVLERPADVAFAADGRLFFADDNGNGVYWIAPTSLSRSN